MEEALRQTNNDITSRWQKEKIIREETTVDLRKVQEEVRNLDVVRTANFSHVALFFTAVCDDYIVSSATTGAEGYEKC